MEAKAEAKAEAELWAKANTSDNHRVATGVAYEYTQTLSIVIRRS